MKFKELITEILKNKIGRIASFIVIGLIILLVVMVINYNKNYEVDTEYLMGILRKSSELTTAELEYKGFAKYKDKGVVILNKSDFLMTYTATARAGIDLDKVKVDADKITKTIWLTIPKAEIQSVNVDPKKITYYDEKFALFNVDQKEDSDRAQALVEDEAKKELAKMGILKMANDQAETLIKGLLQGSIPEGYEVKVRK